MADKSGVNSEALQVPDAESREAETARLREIQAKVAEIDPDVAEWDLDDPESRLALVLTDAILFNGVCFRLETTDSSGRTETVAFETAGEDPNGDGVTIISFYTSTGVYSPEHAELTADVVHLADEPDPDAEIAGLVEEV